MKKTVLTPEEKQERMQAHRQTESYKASRRAYMRTYRQSKEGQAYRRDYDRSEKCKAYRRAWRQSEKGKAYYRAYNQTEKGKAYIRTHQQSEKHKATQRAYGQSKKYKAYQHAYSRSKEGKAALRSYRLTRYHRDMQYKLTAIQRSRLNKVLHGSVNAGSAVRLLGCTLAKALGHLERQFKPGMSWENWSFTGWHVDHRRPLSSFNLNDPAQKAAACHYTNLQPLWATDNLRKGARA